MKTRSWLVVSHDLVAVVGAWWLAHLLRYNLDLHWANRSLTGYALPWVLGINAISFWHFGLYRGIWRFASLPDLKRISFAVLLAALVAPLCLFFVSRLDDVPRSVLILFPILLMMIMGGSRFLYRSWKDGHLLSISEIGRTPILVLGAGEAAMSLLRSLAGSSQWYVRGLLDDDEVRFGTRMHGVEVLGAIADVGRISKEMGVSSIVIAMPSASPATRRRATEIATEAGLKVLTVPALPDLLSGSVAISQMRSIELEDLLGRDPVQLDTEGLNQLLSGGVVMVTGAGGSIGSELCRQIATFSPAEIIFFEQSEFAIYQLEQEFIDLRSAIRITCVVGDVRDEALLDAVISQCKPRIIFHAAAYKHVPLMEGINAWTAVRNNVMGTRNVAAAAIRNQVFKVVLVSTDKAVNPTNVMGATKRLAERVCQAIQKTGETQFVIVRFGNVLGSSGSVVPKFRAQIEQGGPVTVTHPDVVRYFMLIPEAAQLVLQAGMMGQGGEVFILDMGEPIKIADLAKDMIRLSGFSEDDIRIEFTGLRPGEKLYEELLADAETTLATNHPKLRINRSETLPDLEWLGAVETWLASQVRVEDEVKSGLAAWVPEYRPQRLA